MLINKEKIAHINSIAHEGKVVVMATDTDGKIWYTVKQDGFESAERYAVFQKDSGKSKNSHFDKALRFAAYNGYASTSSRSKSESGK
jgi:hypothetical protein